MRKKRTRQRPNYTPWIIGAGLAAIVLVALLVWANQGPSGTATATALDKCGQPTCGQADAKVTIDEYSDFQ